MGCDNINELNELDELDELDKLYQQALAEVDPEQAKLIAEVLTDDMTPNKESDLDLTSSCSNQRIEKLLDKNQLFTRPTSSPEKFILEQNTEEN